MSLLLIALGAVGRYTGERLDKESACSLQAALLEPPSMPKDTATRNKSAAQRHFLFFYTRRYLVPPGSPFPGYTLQKSSHCRFGPREMPGVLSVGLLAMAGL